MIAFGRPRQFFIVKTQIKKYVVSTFHFYIVYNNTIKYKRIFKEIYSVCLCKHLKIDISPSARNRCFCLKKNRVCISVEQISGKTGDD